MKALSFAAVLLLAACTGNGSGDDASSGDDGGSDTSPTTDHTFDHDCQAPAAGGAAQCGKISVRWSLALASTSTTCSAVAGAKISIKATFQADGRSTMITAPCGSGATLSDNVPLGPYALNVSLLDASGASLGSATSTATIAAAGVVSEANVNIDVMPKATPGGTFGACSPSQPCANSTDTCFDTGTGQTYCSPSCTRAMECEELGHAYGLPNAMPACINTTSSTESPKVCVMRCLGDAYTCPSDWTCSASPVGICVPR